MTDEIPRLAGVLGKPYLDEEGMPVFRYSPPAPASRENRTIAAHMVGNHVVKVLSLGNGLFFPYARFEDVFALCGDFRSEAHGGGRLFATEGGTVKPVVGPDDSRADRSDVASATLTWSPFSVDKEFSPPGFAVRQRLLLSLTNVPAIVVLYYVRNLSEGARWLTLHDVWDFSPFLLHKKRRLESPLGKRLLSALRRSASTQWDNSYLTLAGQAGGARAQLSFGWNREVASKRLGEPLKEAPPSLQILALTKNLKLSLGQVPEALRLWLPPVPDARKEQASERVVLESRFQPAAGETQVAASVFWLGDWENARAGIRQLLPVNMLAVNEGIVWRKRSKMALLPVDQSGRETATWESAWHAGLAFVAPWKQLGGEDMGCFPGAAATLRSSTPDDLRLGALLAASLTFSAPALAEELLLCATRKLVAKMEQFEHRDEIPETFLEDVLYTTWALGGHIAAAGVPESDRARELLAGFLQATAETLEAPRLYGPRGLLTTRWADANRLVHRLGGFPEVQGADVESVAATALMVAALERAAGQCVALKPQACSELSDLAADSRRKLLELFNGRHFPRWLWKDKRVGHKRMFLDHHVWLLLMGLPDEMAAVVAGEIQARLMGVVGGGGVATLDARFDEFPVKSGGDLGTVPAVDPILSALLLSALSPVRPDLALSIFRAVQFESALTAQPDEWSRLFLRGNERRLEGEEEPMDIQEASCLGAIAGSLGRISLLGLRGFPGGMIVCVPPLAEYALESTTLSILRSGARISGSWSFRGPRRTIGLLFDTADEAAAWEVTGGLSGGLDGRILKLEVEAKSRWSIRRSSP